MAHRFARRGVGARSRPEHRHRRTPLSQASPIERDSCRSRTYKTPDQLEFHMPYPLSKMIKRETDQNEEFSLVLGGPLYQLLLRSRLIEPPFGNLGWRIGVISA